MRIKPSEYSIIAAAVTDEGLAFHGEVIPLEAQNTARLAEAVDTLRREVTPEPSPADLVEQAFAKTVRAIETATAEFSRLQSMNLDVEGRLRLLLAVEEGVANLNSLRDTITLD